MLEAKSLNMQPIKILRTNFLKSCQIFERWYVNRNMVQNVKEWDSCIASILNCIVALIA